MTAEIAMLNREGVALAADSAVTFRTSAGLKVLPSANKIFTVSKFHPVGAMVYGNALLMGAPWELLIKSYRQHLGTRRFARLEDYAADLIGYLAGSRTLFPEPEQDAYVLNTAHGNCEDILREILKAVGAAISANKQVTEAEILRLARDAIQQQHAAWTSYPVPSVQSSDLAGRLRTRYADGIQRVAHEVFEKLPLPDDLYDLLVESTIAFVSRLSAQADAETESGLVIAGYGDNDVYPSLRSYRVDAVVANELIYTEDPKRHHDVSGSGSAIVPFAQSEMVFAFMEGVDPRYQAALDHEMRNVLRKFAEIAADASGLPADARTELQTALQGLADQVYADFAQQAAALRMAQFASPTLAITQMLPKDELAAMAESLVNLRHCNEITESSTCA